MKAFLTYWYRRLAGRCQACGEPKVDDCGPFWGGWPHRCQAREES